MAVAGWLMTAALPEAGANNILVTNVAVLNPDVKTKTVSVAFDLAWENSWRNGDNWDAAWVFVKFRAPGSNDWKHATLSADSAAHRPAANSMLAAVPDGKGVFIYGSRPHTGSVSYLQTRLQWNCGSDGYAFEPAARPEMLVLALPMVYLPSGKFFAGSGGDEEGHFYQYPNVWKPYPVRSEKEIAVGPTEGNLYYGSVGGVGGDGRGPIPAAFPKGYAAFYCMKYEITQGQYADFLNTLTEKQWTNRNTSANFNALRHSISGNYTKRSSAGAPDRACNWLSWADLTAYADWAALRPMTELEFEKACRGAGRPVPYEFAWGSAPAVNQLGHDKSAGPDGSGQERAAPPTANCLFSGGVAGPVRGGIYGGPDAPRAASGAGYYGVLELSGNDWERAVTVGRPEGRSFQGTLGDGLLAADGNAMGNADWPVDGVGSGFKGGCWHFQSFYMYVSYRGHAVHISRHARMSHYGGRAVRQAP